MDKPKDGSRRKVFLINPEFQLSFMAYMVLMAFLAIAIFYGANIYFFWKFQQQGQALGLPNGHVFFQFLAEQRQTMDYIFALTALGVFAFLCIGGLFLSHRVAGPLHHLRRHMDEVVQGRSTEGVAFRRKDYFKELASDYNRLLKHLRGGGPSGG